MVKNGCESGCLGPVGLGSLPGLSDRWDGGKKPIRRNGRQTSPQPTPFNTVLIADHRETPRQGPPPHLQLLEPQGNMSHGQGVQEVATHRLRHQTVEERLSQAGNLRIARRFLGVSPGTDQYPVRSFTALHRASHRADNAHGPARTG